MALALAFLAGLGEDSVVYKRLYIRKPSYPINRVAELLPFRRKPVA